MIKYKLNLNTLPGIQGCLIIQRLVKIISIRIPVRHYIKINIIPGHSPVNKIVESVIGPVIIKDIS